YRRQPHDPSGQRYPHPRDRTTSIRCRFLFRPSAGRCLTSRTRQCRHSAVDIIGRMGFVQLSDEELLADARRRAGAEREALVNELFARHYERVARLCLRFTGNRDSAADLAQDVFLKAHRHLDSFPEASRLSTWLYSSVRNESFDRMQRAPPPADSDEVLA